MITTVEKVLFLKSVDLFSQIPGEDLAQIALITSEESRESGEDVVIEGEVGDALFIVLDGQVKVHRKEKAIAQLGPRECFGEMALLDASPRSATVTAATDVALLKISREDFQEIMADKHAISQGVIKVLIRRLRDAINR